VPDGPFASAMPTSLNSEALLFAGAVTIATALLFGLFPAVRATRIDLASTLRGSSGQPSGGRGAARLRTALATTQIALSVMLLVIAGLLVKSLMHVSRMDIGIVREQLLTFRVAPELNGYTPQRASVFTEQLQDELAAQPGVTSVTGSFVPAVAGDNRGKRVRVEDFQDVSGSQYNEIGSRYFTTMGIPLIAGREFTPADTSHSPRVAVVNEAFAKHFGLGRDVVGRRMTWCCARERTAMPAPDTEIVGLVKDARYSMVKDDAPPVFYIPYRQTDDRGLTSFYVRSASDPGQLSKRVRQVVADLDPTLPIDHLKTMEQQVRDNVFLDWFIGMLSTSFAALAMLLAAIGLYGVLAYTIAQRTREIGLRIALGAAPRRVRGMILRQVAGMTAVGVGLGLAGALALGRAAQTLLFEMQGHDPIVLSAAAVTVTLVAFGAGAVPAYLASRVDPMVALRPE
jgi:predicted permease